jgi:hypothetical protein
MEELTWVRILLSSGCTTYPGVMGCPRDSIWRPAQLSS